MCPDEPHDTLHPLGPAALAFSAIHPGELEKRTCGQAVNGEWHCCHYGRVTASRAYDIHTTYNCTPRKLDTQAKRDTCKRHARKMLILAHGENYKDISNVPAIKWGVDHELQALSNYIEDKIHPGNDTVVAADCGLFVHLQHPWLACSPDAILHEWDPIEQQWTHTLLEVKCPYTLRAMSTKSLKAMDSSYIQYNHETRQWELNMQHQSARRYHMQIQMSLAILGLPRALLLVWTPNALMEVEVMRQGVEEERKMIAVLRDFRKQWVEKDIDPDLYRDVTEQARDATWFDYLCKRGRHSIRDFKESVAGEDSDVGSWLYEGDSSCDDEIEEEEETCVPSVTSKRDY